MTQILFLSITGLIALTVQSSTIFKIIPNEIKPDLALILIAWSTGRIKFSIGVCFSFCYGLCLDMMSGSPLGLIGLLYLLTYVFFGYIDSFLEVTGVGRIYFTIFLACVFIYIALHISRGLLGEMNFGVSQLYWVLITSISTATFSWLIFKLLDRSWSEYSRIVGTT
ncbi:MAG: rod shape-determining protein MreD [Desulfomonilaceae bacterium]